LTEEAYEKGLAEGLRRAEKKPGFKTYIRRTCEVEVILDAPGTFLEERTHLLTFWSEAGRKVLYRDVRRGERGRQELEQIGRALEQNREGAEMVQTPPPNALWRKELPYPEGMRAWWRQDASSLPSIRLTYAYAGGGEWGPLASFDSNEG
jgi:hypothetical protein